MADLVDYLHDKLEAAQAGCACPHPKLLGILPVGTYMLADCQEHGQRRIVVGGFGYQVVGGRR